MEEAARAVKSNLATGDVINEFSGASFFMTAVVDTAVDLRNLTDDVAFDCGGETSVHFLVLLLNFL